MWFLTVAWERYSSLPISLAEMPSDSSFKTSSCLSIREGHRLAAGLPERGGVIRATTDLLEDYEAGRLGPGTAHKPFAELIRTGRT